MRHAELSEKVLCKVDARPVAEAVAVHVRNGFRSKVSIHSFLSEIRGIEYICGNNAKNSYYLHLCCDLGYPIDAHFRDEQT